MPPQERYDQAVALFDAANARDPNRESAGGKMQPKELLYAQRMSMTLQEFMPNAPEVLRLAVRCQHICRWEMPRGHYPQGRVGYLRWRTSLYDFHAQKATEILSAVGYEEDTVQRVCYLLRKKGLRDDPNSKALEDVVCLVFFKYYLADFAQKHPREKIREILQKTWRKMSVQGRKAALKLEFTARALLDDALDYSSQKENKEATE